MSLQNFLEAEEQRVWRGLGALEIPRAAHGRGQPALAGPGPLRLPCVPASLPTVQNTGGAGQGVGACLGAALPLGTSPGCLPGGVGVLWLSPSPSETVSGRLLQEACFKP